MRGICFIEPLFHKVVSGEKTQTRRILKPQPDAESKKFKPRYKVGEKLYLKEPFAICVDEYEKPSEILYKHGELHESRGILPWKNKRFMPAKYARYFIEITGVRCERLQDISYEDCFKEGIFKANSVLYTYVDPVYENGLEFIDRRGCAFTEQHNTPREAYAALIKSINGKRTWESDPLVWVYDFKLTDNKQIKDK